MLFSKLNSKIIFWYVKLHVMGNSEICFIPISLSMFLGINKKLCYIRTKRDAILVPTNKQSCYRLKLQRQNATINSFWQNVCFLWSWLHRYKFTQMKCLYLIISLRIPLKNRVKTFDLTLWHQRKLFRASDESVTWLPIVGFASPHCNNFFNIYCRSAKRSKIYIFRISNICTSTYQEINLEFSLP